MHWIKKGLIYGPHGFSSWAKHSALQPTPWVLPDGTIRIFTAFRDASGVGRIGYIDVSGRDPSRVLTVSKKPVLDIGAPGAFDDNGVVPCAVVRHGSGLFLYYAGYQLSHHVRFMAFSGLAISRDGGDSFTRYSTVPVTDRVPGEYVFRAVHTIMHEKNKWRVWYGAGDRFIKGKEKTLPTYDIRYMESPDGIRFPDHGTPCISPRPGEYRIGRPYVIKRNNRYEMYFCYATKKDSYRLTMATSADGVRWRRDNSALGLSYSRGEFDSHMSAYPSVISAAGNTYLFYNGNDYGRMGVGYAPSWTNNMPQHQYKLQVKASDDQIKNRGNLIRLFRRTPLPDEHLMVNLGLYQRSSLVAKYFWLKELYTHILPIPGVIMEFGSWYGQALVQFMNLRAILEPYNYTRKVIGFDTFTGYLGITPQDGKHELVKKHQYSVPKEYLHYLTELLDYHEKENSMPHIKKYELVPGDAAVTVKKYLRKNPHTLISLAYFDMQLYKPTKACLSAILPYMVKGAVIAMDELNAHEFPGETQALKEVLGITKYPLYRSTYLPDRSYLIIT